ncbi:hypothetical protein D9611_010113 [Ephemerocybe angulata]|uniref:Uncharacterized protein n=1 Tax=Ephemerocybe angulata TaxID=980116 RepID=A0A8H5EV11_9AGAR|nr:hypothetical protein D9611_010113 [Tulosesus angulatus]
MVYISRSTLAAAAVIAFIAPALAMPMPKKTHGANNQAANQKQPANQKQVAANQKQNPPPRAAKPGPSTSRRVVNGLEVANTHVAPLVGTLANAWATVKNGAPPPGEAPGPIPGEAPMRRRDYNTFGRRNIDPVELDFESREYEEEMEAREVEEVLDLFRRAFDLDETD